jgi:hypothetical protein
VLQKYETEIIDASDSRKLISKSKDKNMNSILSKPEDI